MSLRIIPVLVLRLSVLPELLPEPPLGLLRVPLGLLLVPLRGLELLLVPEYPQQVPVRHLQLEHRSRSRLVRQVSQVAQPPGLEPLRQVPEQQLLP
ncbi:MAG: hypothetical protein AB1611_00885 [bacterium]